jgi:hypothetical protein
MSLAGWCRVYQDKSQAQTLSFSSTVMKSKERSHVCMHCVHNKTTKPNCTWITVSGNLINYSGNVGTPHQQLTSSQQTTLQQCHLNARSKIHGDWHFKFLFVHPMEQYKYTQLKLEDIPDYMQLHYNLKQKANDGFVYIKTRNGMYWLPQAWIITKNSLKYNSTNMVTSRASTHPVYGHTKHDQHNSALWLTLVLNT